MSLAFLFVLMLPGMKPFFYYLISRLGEGEKADKRNEDENALLR